jgi:hypothetical protein
MKAISKRSGKCGFQLILLFMVMIPYIAVAGCTSPDQSVQAVQVTPTKTATQSVADTPMQIDRQITASIKHFILNPGDTISVEGTVYGSTDPVSYSVYTLEDAMAKNFNSPLLTGSVAPASDGTYTFQFSINSQNVPVGSYFIIIKLSTGETTKLQFLVEAKDVDCDKICSQPGPALRYNEKGEAICPC